MTHLLTTAQIIQCGIDKQSAETLCTQLNVVLEKNSLEQSWLIISKEILTPQHPFALHLMLFKHCSANGLIPAWAPTAEMIKNANITHLMQELKIDNVKAFHEWTVTHYEEFWQRMLKKLGIVFKTAPEKMCDLSLGIESPNWLPGAKLNIIESCFTAKPDKTALIFEDKNKKLQHMSYAELNRLSNRIANGIVQNGFVVGDAIAIDMPMTKEAIAIYLGIIKAGCVVVSIADSFSPEEIVTRLRITHAKGIFTQDYILRGDKKIPLYEKVIAANAPKTIVIPCEENSSCELRANDIQWHNFISDNDQFTAVACDPMSACNILFSSGTTGDPKAIPWNHTTAIKSASDAHLHQNIQEGDVLAWPTNLGWMMGPWLIFAALVNRAAIAVYADAPRDQVFGKFIQDAKVTMLGIVPTIVATWRQSHCMAGLNWQSLKVFSSTGECSNAEDMLYLMSLAGYKPVIEYCGGTEIGGSYLSSTVVEKNYPSLFTTPVMGIDLTLIDETGQVTDNGEVAIIPPSIGLSTKLLNKDHHEIYYANMPSLNGKTLRRHGDQAQHLTNGCYCVLGRVDDTMNLGAIKVSSAEIERVLSGTENIIETAAIAVPPQNNGPSQLVIFAATLHSLDKAVIKKSMQEKINKHLNPLFKIHDVVFVKELPKTASNKIMRRVLRKDYLSLLT